MSTDMMPTGMVEITELKFNQRDKHQTKHVYDFV